MKKSLSLLLSIAMMVSMITIPAMAAEAPTTTAPAAEVIFSDTANHWGAKAIARWAKAGVVKGDGGKFTPDGNLTRGALATILTNLLGLTKQSANLYSDVPATAWYADAVLKCTAAGIMKGDGVRANPEANISRQEAMTMLARALGIQPAKTADLTAFKDADQVAPWAAGYVTAMTKANIVSGIGGGLVAPLGNMNRASVVTVLDKAISDYITTTGTYDKVVGTGIVVATAPGIVLKNTKIAGSLLVAEGVGSGDFTLDNTAVAGNTTIRGGGVNSFIVKGGSKLGDVTIARVDGAVRIVTSGGSTIATTYVNDGKDDVIMEGSFGDISVACEVPVTLKGADVKTVTATGKNADISVDAKSKVLTVATAQENTKITVAGTVTNVAATAEAKGVALNVAKGGTATSVATAATGSVIKNYGNVGALAVAKGADTIFAKGETATKTNITAADKKDLSITTIAAQEAKEAVAKAAADKLAAEQAAAKAAADKAAAVKLAADAKSDAEKAAAAKAQADAAAKEAAAKAAADKAAADKAAADKAQADSKKEEDKVKEDTKVEEKPVTPPVVGEDGKIDPPKPIEPEKPTPAPDPGPAPDPSLENIIDDFIESQVAGLNTNMKGYASLGALDKATNKIVCTITGDATTVRTVASDIQATMVTALTSNTAVGNVNKVMIGTSALTITSTMNATAILDFVKGAALKDNTKAPVVGTTTIGALVGTSITATVYDKNGYSYNYTITFKSTTP